MLQKKLDHNTQTDKVLNGTEFYYCGSNAIDIPKRFEEMKWKHRYQGVCNDENKINEFITYIRDNYTIGRHGIPHSRKDSGFVHYKALSGRNTLLVARYQNAAFV